MAINGGGPGRLAVYYPPPGVLPGILARRPSALRYDALVVFLVKRCVLHYNYPKLRVLDLCPSLLMHVAVFFRRTNHNFLTLHVALKSTWRCSSALHLALELALALDLRGVAKEALTAL